MKLKKLNSEALEVIAAIVKKHQNEMGPVIVMLHDVQASLGYIPVEAMQQIAKACQVSVSEVYGVVTFYAQFTTEPKGVHVVNVCLGTACYVKGAQAIINDLQTLTEAKVNGTSDDGLFSLDATRCLGACGLAPVVVIDEKVYGNADQTATVKTVINQIIAQERGH